MLAVVFQNEALAYVKGSFVPRISVIGEQNARRLDPGALIAYVFVVYVRPEAILRPGGAEASIGAAAADEVFDISLCLFLQNGVIQKPGHLHHGAEPAYHDMTAADIRGLSGGIFRSVAAQPVFSLEEKFIRPAGDSLGLELQLAQQPPFRVNGALGQLGVNRFYNRLFLSWHEKQSPSTKQL